MLLSSLRTKCYQRLGWGTTPTSDISDRVDLFINDTIKEVVSDPVTNLLRRWVVSFSTVANSQYAALPQAATFIHSIIDPTNRRELSEVSIAWIDARDPARTFSSSAPLAYAVRGYASPVCKQPAASGQMTVKSTAAGDVTQVVNIEIVTSQGYVRTATATLSGTTGVNIGAADALYIKDVYLATVATGEVTLLDASSNELTRIGIGLYRAKYTLVELYPKPSAVMTLYADADLDVTDLVNATDETCIPDVHYEIIVHGVRAREYQKREKLDMAGAAMKDFNRMFGKLKLKMAVKSQLAENSVPGFSQLGPYFPAGS